MIDVGQLIKQIKSGKVDHFRRDFDSLTFADVCRIYDDVTPHFGPQRHFDFKQFKRAAVAVELSGVVAELGDHDGELARMVLQDFPGVSEWIGYDVCDAETRLEHPKYKHITLSDWMHKSITLTGIDAFVSTHTIEHMSRKSALETLDFVSKSQVNKMVLEMPFRNNGHWERSKSLHVFKGTPTDIMNALKHGGWEIVFHNAAGMNHTWGCVR